MAEDVRAADIPAEEIERRDTGLRILISLLFMVIAALIESLVGLIVIFELLWSLITRQPPRPRVRELANRIVAYYYRIGRYLTYNESEPPFPFSDFPAAVEPDAWRGGGSEAESLGLPDWDESDDSRGSGF